MGHRSLVNIPNPRLHRLKEKCLRFRFKMQYCPGKDNQVPYCMSRIHHNKEDGVDEY